MEVIRRLAVKLCDREFRILAIRRVGWIDLNLAHIGGRNIDASFLKECCIDLSQYDSLELWAVVRLAEDGSVQVMHFSMDLRLTA